MSKLKILFIALFFIISLKNVKAQSIQHTIWKSFFASPINDTATLSIGNDTLMISSSRGMKLDVATITINKDTIKISDLSGPIKCPSSDIAIYSYAISNNKLVLTIISDDCDGRANAISGRQWTEVMTKREPSQKGKPK